MEPYPSPKNFAFVFEYQSFEKKNIHQQYCFVEVY